MMDLRSSSRVLRPRQFQEIKEVIKSSHVLPQGARRRRSGRQIVHQTLRRFGAMNVHDIVSHVMEFFREFFRPPFCGIAPRFLFSACFSFVIFNIAGRGYRFKCIHCNSSVVLDAAVPPQMLEPYSRLLEWLGTLDTFYPMCWCRRIAFYQNWRA
ncbi:hypothetical protein TNCV_2292201 [Trichonephila clavipes]|uniref:Uncharacterized protein n=1 Tax=Trichonephila clavipes TaxID=2585209 RepID=A0A8X6V638_TRICX|nr:hypothetical protein TNCV_2292201 [Trichonephila clavipes]